MMDMPREFNIPVNGDSSNNTASLVRRIGSASTHKGKNGDGRKKGTVHLKLASILDQKNPELRSLFFTQITKVEMDKNDKESHKSQKAVKEKLKKLLTEGDTGQSDLFIPSSTTNKKAFEFTKATRS